MSKRRTDLDLQAPVNKLNGWTHACFCVGPKNGEPLCRCRMKNVQIKDGRYIEILDHGPAPDTKQIDMFPTFPTNSGLFSDDY
jgi:hypothetical protein